MEIHDDDHEIGVFLSTTALIVRRFYRRPCQRWGSSRSGKQANRARDFAGRYARFQQLYFNRNPVYSAEQFRRRFRMRRELFQRIVAKVEAHDDYFKQKRDCTGKPGIQPVMKITAALRMLTYGCPGDSLDKTLEISETVVHCCTKRFARAINEINGEEFLRRPTDQDIERLLFENSRRGFPGMLGSLDCMKWRWKNCPSGWKGGFQGACGKPTIVLEAIASYDLHIWHAFIGMPGSNNDLNVLDASPILSECLDDDTSKVEYEVKGQKYSHPYWLADGIYPELKCFVKTFANPIGDEQLLFAKAQKAVRKDVERAFGVLQARFAIVTRPARLWKLDDIIEIMRCCIILHNMIVANDRETGRQV